MRLLDLWLVLESKKQCGRLCSHISGDSATCVGAGHITQKVNLQKEVAVDTLKQWLLLFLFFCFSSSDFKSKFEVERKDTDGYGSSATSGSQQQHPLPLLPLPTPPHPFSSSSSSAGVTGAGGVPVATLAHLPDSTTDSWSGYYSSQRQDGHVKPFANKGASLKQRCRDYDGRNNEFSLFYYFTLYLFFYLFHPISNLHFVSLYQDLCIMLALK